MTAVAELDCVLGDGELEEPIFSAVSLLQPGSGTKHTPVSPRLPCRYTPRSWNPVYMTLYVLKGRMKDPVGGRDRPLPLQFRWRVAWTPVSTPSGPDQVIRISRRKRRCQFGPGKNLGKRSDPRRQRLARMSEVGSFKVQK